MKPDNDDIESHDWPSYYQKTSANPKDVLQRVFGYEDFRLNQNQIVDSCS